MLADVSMEVGEGYRLWNNVAGRGRGRRGTQEVRGG